MALNLAVVIGSTRPGRIGPKVADWFAGIARSDLRFEVDLVDLADFGFPLPMAEGMPRRGDYHPQAIPFAARMAAADAFVFVTPEYNHGYSAALKSALDAIYREWVMKPAGFVSYGGISGGINATQQLRQICGELQLHDIQASVAIPLVSSAFDEAGNLVNPHTANSATAMLNQLEWWATTLNDGRANHPFQR